MPRIRTIKPQFWLDENLGEIPRDARLLYIGLWNLSDDTGVFLWRPQQIKVQIFPYDSDIGGNDIAGWLKLLQSTGDIEYIEHNGKGYGRIKSFLKHQDIKNPSKWSYLGDDESTPDIPQDYPSTTPALPIGKEEKKKVKSKKTIEHFEIFWKEYPKKRNKGQAEKAFEKVSPDEQLMAAILTAIERAKKSAEWLKAKGQYIPYPATWLNAKGWEDEYGEISSTTGDGGIRVEE